MSRSTHIPSAATVSLFALALIAACAPASEEAPPPEPAVDVAAEAAAIMELERQWSAMFAADDVDGIMNLHAADAIQMPPAGEPIIGHEALRAAWEGMATTEGLEISWEPTAAFVSPDGNMAYDYGAASVTAPDGTTSPSKYLVVWVKVDGEWKIAADMFNSSVAPE